MCDDEDFFFWLEANREEIFAGGPARGEAIRRACEIDCEEVFSQDVDRYTRTELLVHAYLSDKRQPYNCGMKSCNRVHDEWFVISTDSAIAAVERWVQFMNQHAPYDVKSLKLNPFWALWLKAHSSLHCTDSDADLVRARWDAIISPSSLDWSRVWLLFAQGIVKTFFWPVFASLGWTVAFVAVRHAAAVPDRPYPAHGGGRGRRRIAGL